MLDSEDDGLFDCLNSIELFLLVLSFVVYSTCVYIICETPLLHVNFMRLYKCFYIEYLVIAVTRIIKLIATLTRVTGYSLINNTEIRLNILTNAGFFGWLELIRYIGFGCAWNCLASFLIERIVATIYLSTYEKWTNNGISWLFIVFHILVGICSIMVMCTEILPFAFQMAFLLVGVGLLPIVTRLLRYYNNRQYEKSKLDNSSYTLSEKFQISENIRSIKILWRLSQLSIAFAFIVLVLFVLSSYLKERLIKRIIFSLFNITLAAYFIISPPIFLLSAHTWKRALMIKLVKLKNLIRAHQITDNSHMKKHVVQLKHLKTLDGKQMVYEREDEQELYFTQLKNVWNIT